MSILDKIRKKDDKKDIKQEIKEEKEVKKETKETKKSKSSGKTVKAKKVSKEKMPVHYFELIKKPHISEKALRFNSENKYVQNRKSSKEYLELKVATRKQLSL